ncbi:DUF3093 domain-containing protein [Pseudolysinimonas kribbensis]|uniref:DUF3093 domain-containing protein n=1 Tax=Pseudolysinimonas kribbensis TaxID=433641 RepID=UPI0031D7C479
MPTSPPAYRERLWPSPWVFLTTALVIPAALLVFLPISETAGIVVAIVLYGAIVVILIATTPLVEVTDAEFGAGRAHLPLAVVHAVRAVEGDEAGAERGVRLDARAFLLIRGWIPDLVRVELDDPSDPTPYWLVSTRHPRRLVAALAGARAGSAD